MSRSDGRRQRYEAQKTNARNAVPDVPLVTLGQLRDYLGDVLFNRIGLVGNDDDPCDIGHLRKRYFSPGGLTRFLEEGFPNSCSLKPYGAGQLRAISIIESVIRNGGVEQSLEPRGFGKSSRVARAAIWAILGGFRRCGVIFQSNADKAVETLTKIKNEIAGSPFLAALAPGICAACRHAALNPGIARRQHVGGALTNIQWLVGSIRLPDVAGEIGCGARLICMPFAKAAGLSLSDPETLEDLRPDLLLPDDCQAHDECSSARITEKLLGIWHGSVKYLAGRGKTAATCFTQTVYEADDLADHLSRDPSVHTVRYKFVEKFSDNDLWWRTEYRKVLLEYDPLDPNGQTDARKAATALYLANRSMADQGCVVSWEHAYDPDSAASAIEQAYRNLLENEIAFWAQDQNEPQAALSGNEDIRAKPSELAKKIHTEGRWVVPQWADRVVAFVDVQDSMLFYGVVAGSETMQAGLIDYQAFPAQKQKRFTLRQAHTKFDDISKYASLPTTQDKIKAALADLYAELTTKEWRRPDGSVVALSRIGIDAGDGDHTDAVHSFCRNRPLCLPTKGMAVKASQAPLNERSKSRSERRRGDHWIERSSERTKVTWLEYDSNYFKARMHKGLKVQLDTSESVSFYHSTNQDTHALLIDHLHAETAAWVTATRVGGAMTGQYEFTKKPQDNHFLDCLAGCMVLLNHGGSRFHDVAAKIKRKRLDLAAMQAEARAKGSKQNAR